MCYEKESTNVIVYKQNKVFDSPLFKLCPLSCLLGGFQVQALNWHCSGDSLIVIGKEQLCLCYMDTDQEDK